jgi:phage terminase large subunit-like protein
MEFPARAERYARAVVAGEYLACKWVKAACQRHLDDLERVARQDAQWPYYLDHEEATRVCQILERMPHVKGDLAKGVRTESGIEYPTLCSRTLRFSSSSACSDGCV